jgi:Low affinity iron permease
MALTGGPFLSIEVGHSALSKPVTFLMVFLIQNTQNRDSAAVHLKLDELIRTVNGAHNALLDLEELTEADLERLRSRYESLGRSAREDLLRGLLDTDTPDVPVDGRSARGDRQGAAAEDHDMASNLPTRHDDIS